MAGRQVQWEENAHGRDCNSLCNNSNNMWYFFTDDSNANAPRRGEKGLLLYAQETGTPTESGSDQGIDKGRQYWYGFTTGDILTRRYTENAGNHRLEFTEWARVSGGGDMTEYIKRPENETQISDANVLNYSGIFRTTHTTQNLPEGVDNPWGVLQHFYENNGSGNQDAKAGFQLYAPITGSGFGNLYIRVFNADHTLTGNNTWKKLNISKLIDMQDQVFTHPTTTLTSVDASTPTGFYLTTEQTTGMEGVPAGSKDGVLKVTKDGDISLQRFQPSVEGSTDIYLRTISVTSPIARESQQPFQNFNKENNSLVKIHDSRDKAVPKPNDYKSKDAGNSEGYVYYEWKFSDTAGTNGIQLPAGENHPTRCILCTYDPDPADSVTGNDYSDLCQIAYFKSGNTYIRHGKNGENDWDIWKPFASGGGTGQTINFPQELDTEIKAWKGTDVQKHPAQASLTQWIHDLIWSDYVTWKDQADSQKSREQKAFEEYVLSALGKGGKRFQKWKEYYTK